MMHYYKVERLGPLLVFGFFIIWNFYVCNPSRVMRTEINIQAIEGAGKESGSDASGQATFIQSFPSPLDNIRNDEDDSTHVRSFQPYLQENNVSSNGDTNDDDSFSEYLDGISIPQEQTQIDDDEINQAEDDSEAWYSAGSNDASINKVDSILLDNQELAEPTEAKAPKPTLRGATAEQSRESTITATT